MNKQSLIKKQMNVMFALFLQDMNKKFGGYHLGTLWVILEPALMIAFFITLFGMRSRGEFGYIEPPVFVLAAFLPFRHFFMKTMQAVSHSSGAFRQFQHFNQIGFFDVLLTNLFATFFTGVISGAIIGFILYWFFGLSVWPHDVLGVLLYVTALSFFGFALGLIIVLVQHVAREIGVIMDLMTIPLLFFSAVFFPMTSVPEPYRTYLAYNPLVHPMEFIRENWFEHYVSPVADGFYLMYWALGILVFSLMYFYTNRRRVNSL